MIVSTKLFNDGPRVLLRVEAPDGRFLLNVCKNYEHAYACIPILSNMLEREKLKKENEASGWRRRLPLTK